MTCTQGWYAGCRWCLQATWISIIRGLWHDLSPSTWQAPIPRKKNREALVKSSLNQSHSIPFTAPTRDGLKGLCPAFVQPWSWGVFTCLNDWKQTNKQTNKTKTLMWPMKMKWQGYAWARARSHVAHRAPFSPGCHLGHWKTNSLPPSVLLRVTQDFPSVSISFSKSPRTGLPRKAPSGGHYL